MAQMTLVRHPYSGLLYYSFKLWNDATAAIKTSGQMGEFYLVREKMERELQKECGDMIPETPGENSVVEISI